MKLRQMSVRFSSSSSEIERWIQRARLILGRSFTFSANLPSAPKIIDNPPNDSFYMFVNRTTGLLISGTSGLQNTHRTNQSSYREIRRNAATSQLTGKQHIPVKIDTCKNQDECYVCILLLCNHEAWYFRAPRHIATDERAISFNPYPDK